MFFFINFNFQSSRNRAFNLRYSWLLIDDSPFNITYVEETLSDVLVLPDGDVTWVSVDRMVDVYKVKADQPLVVTHLGMRRSRRELEGLWRSLRTTVTRRKNLHSVYLKSATIVCCFIMLSTVIFSACNSSYFIINIKEQCKSAYFQVTQPQYFKGWSDLSNRQIDTFPKLTYPILKLCGEDLNFR